MNKISRTIAGISSIALGLYMIYEGISSLVEGWMWVVGSGIFFVIVGIFIFFNKKEDNIEKIKNIKN